jgi:hypothetical protein
MSEPISWRDCRISWYKGGWKQSVLTITHLPTGHRVQRQAELRDNWQLDDALRELEAIVQSGQGKTRHSQDSVGGTELRPRMAGGGE